MSRQETRKLSGEVGHRGVTNSLYMFNDENSTDDEETLDMRQLVSEYAERVEAHCLHAQTRCKGSCGCFCRVCIPFIT